MEIVKNDQVDNGLWNSILNESAFSSPFQTPSYYTFVNSLNGHSSNVYAVRSNGEYKALVVVTIQKEVGVKGYFSRRGIIFGGLVINGATKEELSFLLTGLKKDLSHQVIYIETRNFFDYSGFSDCFTANRWRYEPYLNVKLYLEGISKEKISSLFKYNRRREIKQSILNGATYRLTSNVDEISEVYRILNELYKDRVKLPLPSLHFFLEFVRSESMKVFVVMHDEKIIGGSFCVVLPGRSIYTFYYCGKRDYSKHIFPTHLAVLAAIEFAIEQNIPVLDFMGAGKSGIDYGVRKYKMEFGGELVEHGRYLMVINPILYGLGKFGLKILKLIK